MLDDASCLFTAGQDRLSRSDRAGTTSRGCGTKGVRRDLLLVTAGSQQGRSVAVRSRSRVSGEQRFTRFDTPSLLGSAPPPAQGAPGIVTSRRRSPGSGTASPRRIYECLTIECTRARHVTAMPGRRSYRDSRWGQRRVAVCPLVGCGSPEGSPAKAALVRLGAEPGTCRPAAGGSGRRLG